MKNKTLLKVLSASAIFTAIAAIESYDHNAFATEVAATANNNQSDVETKTVPQDVKNLPDGTYDLKKEGEAEALNFSEEGKKSMAAAGLDTEKTKLVVKNGQYSVNVSFKPITFGGLTGYLGDLKYYDGDKTHANRSEIKDSDFKDTTIIENYSENQKDAFVNVYKKKFPGRTVYPKTLSYNVDKNKIDANNKLETFTQVFVPVMESIFPGAGTQRMILKYNLSSLATKTITVPKVDKEKLAREKAEKERIEKERLAKEKAEKERIKKEKLAKEKAEKERIEKEKLAKEKAEKERIEKERLAKEKAEKERIEREKLANEKAEKERIEREKLAKEKAEKERIEKEKLAKEKAEKERIEREKALVTAKGEAAIAKKPEFDLDGFIKNHNSPITAKGEAAILEKPEFDLDGYIREQKGSVGETTPASDKKPLINDIFGQSKVKDTFVATPLNTKESNATTANVKKSLANTGITTTTTTFLGLASLLTAFVLRRKFNK